MGCAQSHEAAAAPARPARGLRHPPGCNATLKLQPLGNTEVDKSRPSSSEMALFQPAATAVVANKALPPGGPPPPAKAQRIKALRQLGTDAQGDACLQYVVELLQQTFAVDLAALSLIDVERQWYKAKAGGTGLTSTARQSAFGSWVLSMEHPGMLVVEDTLQDARFAQNEYVLGPPHLRFYAGAPLMASDGAIYGVLFIAGYQPRRFAAEQLTILANFAEVCVCKLEAPRLPELRCKAAAADEGHGRPLMRDLATMQDAVFLCNLETERWELRWANKRFAELAGIPQGGAPGRDVWSLLRLVAADPGEAMSECDASIFLKQPFTVTVAALSQDPGGALGPQPEGLLELRLRHSSRGLPSAGDPGVGIPSWVPSESELEGVPHDSLACGAEHLWWAQVVPASPAGTAGAPDAAGGVGAACAGPGADTSPGSRAGWSSASVGAGPPGSAAASPGLGPGSSSPGALDVSLTPELSRPSFGASCSAGKLRTMSFTVPAGLSNTAAVFDQVQLGALLGSGSYGRVYRGFWRGTEVAVKVMDYYCSPINDSYELNAEKHSSLLEALLGRQFSRHPCLVQTFDLGLKPVEPFDPSQPSQEPVRHSLWIVLEFCNRGTLHDAVLKGRFRLNPYAPDSGPNLLSILQTAQDIAGGMSLLHDAGILHSDLSANNVMLKAAANSRRFTAAVSDFGLSRICCDEGGKRTQTVGTVTHQPPELLAEGILTPACDVYAFGILLHTMYTGQHPFNGDLPSTVIHKVVSARRCPLQLPQDAPEGLKSLYERCVAYDRTQRPGFHEILSLLAPIVERAEAEAPPSPKSPRGRPASRDFMLSPSFRRSEGRELGSAQGSGNMDRQQ